MNALQTFHQAHKERVARIEAAAHRAKMGKQPAPAPTFEAPPVSDMSSLFGEAWSLLEGNGRQGPPPVSVIQRVVAKHYCVSRLDLLSQRRTANVVRPRQVAMYLAKNLTSRSFPDIGARFGGRDHTTALHAFRKIERLIETDAVLAAQVSEIRNEIEGL